MKIQAIRLLHINVSNLDKESKYPPVVTRRLSSKTSLFLRGSSLPALVPASAIYRKLLKYPEGRGQGCAEEWKKGAG